MSDPIRPGSADAPRADSMRAGASEAAAEAVRAGAGGPASRSDLIWAGICGAVTALFAAILASVVFARIPHVQDSVAQLFQARIFARGRLWAPSPPLKEFFNYTQMINDGRWYSQYPPGHALLLVPGVWIGAPWLINPLLAGIGVFASVLLARELFGSPVARITGMLAVLSPFLVLMAAEFMSHVSGFAVLTLFLLLYFRILRHGRSRDGAIAGGLFALAILIRPYTAVAAAAPILLHGAWRARLDRRLLGPAVWIVAGGAAGLVLFGLYNWGTTGSPFVPGYVKLYGPSHGLGFGKGTWGPPHTLTRGLEGSGQQIEALNSALFGWPLSSLWPLVLALLPISIVRFPGGRRGSSARDSAGAGKPGRQGIAPARDSTGAGSGGRGDPRPGDQRPGGPKGRRDLRSGAPESPSERLASFRLRWLLAAVPVCLLAAYVFYWYRDLCFGPRFVYEALGPILILTAYGLVVTGRWLAGVVVPQARGNLRVVPGAVVGGALFVFAFAAHWPGLFRIPDDARAAPPASQLRMASYFQAFGPNFWGVGPALGRLVKSQGLTHALVFTRMAEPEFQDPPYRYLFFGSAFAHEEPDVWRADVVYARDLGRENASLAALFPDRRIYLYTGSIEGGSLHEVRPGGSVSW